MKMSFTYFRHTAAFSGVVSKAIFYMVAIIGDNCERIAKPSFCWYMSDSLWKNVVYTENVNIFSILCVGMLLCSLGEGL